MAGSLTTIASLSGNYVDHLYEDALFVARAESLLPSLVTKLTDQSGDQPRTLSEYPKFSAQTVTETEDFDNPSELTKTAISTLTPIEIIAQSRITDRRVETDPQGAQADASRELGEALADNIDSGLVDAFSDLTGPELGAGATPLTWDAIFAARTALAAENVPGPYAVVIHPFQYHPLAKAASVAGEPTNAPSSLVDEVSKRWYVASTAGVDIFVTSRIPVVDGVALGAVFNSAALALDVRRAPRLETQRDASARLTELDFTAKYAAGVWRPKFGATLSYTADPPADVVTGS